jgi:hypothetical protein
MLPDLALGFAETMATTFESGRVDQLTPREISQAISACDFLRGLFTEAHRSIEEGLSQGVDARAFAAKYERAVIELQAILTTAERIVTKARTSPLPAPAELFVSNYRELMDAMLRLRQLLAEAVDKAKRPTGPIDWQRVRDTEAAYTRGETKPFQRSSKRTAGE